MFRRGRLRLEYIGGRTRNPTSLESVIHRNLIPYRASAKIDEVSRWLHQIKRTRPNQMARVGNQRNIQRHNVRLRQQLLERNAARRECGRALATVHGVAIQNRAAEAQAADLRDPPSNAAEAD